MRLHPRNAPYTEGGSRRERPSRLSRRLALLLVAMVSTACAPPAGVGFQAVSSPEPGLSALPDGTSLSALTAAPPEAFPAIVRALPADLLATAGQHPLGFIAPTDLPAGQDWELVPWKSTAAAGAYGYALRSTEAADEGIPPEIEIRVERVAGEDRADRGVDELGSVVEQLDDAAPWPVHQGDAAESVTLALDDGSDVVTVRLYKGCPERSDGAVAGLCWSWDEIAALVGGLTVMEVAG